VGWGRAAAFSPTGDDRFADADDWWAETVDSAVVRDEMRLPGTGLVAFGSFTFAGGVGSTLVVPEVVVGRRDGRSWITTIGRSLSPSPVLSAVEPEAPSGSRFVDDEQRRSTWSDTVDRAVHRIQAGDLDKVVLARSVEARFDEPLDVRSPLSRLAAGYPSCWTFHVDGFFGSTPEMLVRLQGGLVTSRVLAGTIRRTGDDARDLTLAA